jgi:hypothetical protein
MIFAPGAAASGYLLRALSFAWALLSMSTVVCQSTHLSVTETP